VTAGYEPDGTRHFTSGYSDESSGLDGPLVLKIIVVVALLAYRRDKTNLCRTGSVMIDRAAEFRWAGVRIPVVAF
jgi:hypothetical protein